MLLKNSELSRKDQKAFMKLLQSLSEHFLLRCIHFLQADRSQMSAIWNLIKQKAQVLKENGDFDALMEKEIALFTT